MANPNDVVNLCGIMGRICPTSSVEACSAAACCHQRFCAALGKKHLENQENIFHMSTTRGVGGV